MNGVVTVDELVRAAGIVSGSITFEMCPAADADASQEVTESEVRDGVTRALGGC